jgi:anti-sigma B factor antagonist
MASVHETFPSFDLTVERGDTVTTVAASGELDLATAPELSTAVAAHHDARLLVLDVTAVTFIDSSGVRALIEADRSRAGSSSRLVVLAGEGPVRRMLELCGLDGWLALVTDHPARAAQRVPPTDTGPKAPPAQRSCHAPAKQVEPPSLGR